jgi:hypothetical protein
VPQNGRLMRTIPALVVAACLLTVLTGCSGSATSDQPRVTTTTVDPTRLAAEQIMLEAPTQVAVKYVDALRHRDAGAIYALASSGLRAAVSRTEFLAETDLSGVSGARISNVLKVGRAEDGTVYAVAPIEVTVHGAVQDGRLILVQEGKRWRYVDSVAPDQAPVIH